MKKGFTIVELLMVVVLIGLLSILVIPNVNRLINKSTQTLSSTQVKSIEDSALNFITDYYDSVKNYDVFIVELKMLKDLSYVKTDIKNVNTGKYFSDNSLITYIKDGENYKASFYGIDSDTISNDVEYVNHIVLLKGANIFVSNNISDTSNVVLMSSAGKLYKYSEYSIETVSSDTENVSIKNITYNITLIENLKQYEFSVTRKESVDEGATGPQFTITTTTNVDKSELTLKIVPESVELAPIPYSFDNGVTWQTSDSKTVTTSFNDVIRIKDSNGNVGLLNYSVSKLTVNANEGVWESLSTNSYFWLVKDEEKSISNPIRPGYGFGGWSIIGDATINGTSLKMGTTDTTISANWTINSYTLTVNANGGTWSGTTPQTIAYGSTATIANPTRNMYRFVSWTVSGTGSSISGTTFTMGTTNATLTANWELNTFTLTVDANGGTWSGTTPQTITQASTVTIANPTRTDYVFGGWTVSGTGSSISGTTFTMGSANSTLTAVWYTYSSMFTYSGTTTVINDGSGNWRIKFLTGGTFKPLVNMTIDVFLVGGGGGSNGTNPGGGGGGYTNTKTTINLTANTNYTIVVGNGGSPGIDGEASTAFGYTANGGYKSINYNGGAGGSGGGCGAHSSGCGGGGGGTDGGGGGSNCGSGGAGQGTTTREFGEAGATLYSGGGGGNGTCCFDGTGGAVGGGSAWSNGTANTGGGGGAFRSGGSGVVIIRQHK